MDRAMTPICRTLIGAVFIASLFGLPTTSYAFVELEGLVWECDEVMPILQENPLFQFTSDKPDVTFINISEPITGDTGNIDGVGINYDLSQVNRTLAAVKAGGGSQESQLKSAAGIYRSQSAQEQAISNSLTETASDLTTRAEDFSSCVVDGVLDKDCKEHFESLTSSSTAATDEATKHAESARKLARLASDTNAALANLTAPPGAEQLPPPAVAVEKDNADEDADEEDETTTASNEGSTVEDVNRALAGNPTFTGNTASANSVNGSPNSSQNVEVINRK